MRGTNRLRNSGIAPLAVVLLPGPGDVAAVARKFWPTPGATLSRQMALWESKGADPP